MLKTFYLLVAGPRSYNDYDQFKYVMDTTCGIIKEHMDRIVIVEGGALGTDGMARNYAIDNKIPYVEIRADWNNHGKSAGLVRNNNMNQYIADKCSIDPKHNKRLVLLFWNGHSRGTASNIDIAKRHGNTACIVFVKTDPESKVVMTSLPADCHINHVIYIHKQIENIILNEVNRV